MYQNVDVIENVGNVFNVLFPFLFFLISAVAHCASGTGGG